MPLFISIVLAALTVLALLATVATSWRIKIKIPMFMGQIQKLVMANNIDHAIKLCNAAPHATFPKLAKSLLIRANRTHELHFAFEEARYQLGVRSLTSSRMGVTQTVLGLAGTLSLSAALYLATSEYDTSSTALFLGIYILAALSLSFTFSSIGTHLRECLQALLKLRNALYGRAQVVPAIHQPRPESAYTAEELAAWKASLDAFNVEYASRKEAGDPLDTPQVEYDTVADDRGALLPPL